MSKLLLLCALLGFSAYSVKAGGGPPRCGGPDSVYIGYLETLFHDVSGHLWAVDEYTFCIAEFTYDGAGPDAFLYFYYPGDPIDDTGGGVIIPASFNDEREGQFELGRVYSGEELTFTLPTNQYRGCDFEGFGIWCRYANQIFSNITWTTADIYSEVETNSRITCTPSPGRAYAGNLPTLDHGVNGELYIRDDKTFVIRNFTYDGQGPGAFVYVYLVGEEADPTGGGIIIPLTSNNGDEGRFDNTVYNGLPEDDFVITIPDNMDLFTCDIGNFTIWCRDFDVFFTLREITIDLFTNNDAVMDVFPNLLVCNRPTTQPGILIGEMVSIDNRAAGGFFYVVDQFTYFIQLFNYNARRESVFIYYFPFGTDRTEDGDGGTVIAVSEDDEGFPMGTSNSFYTQTFIIDVRRAMDDDDVRTCDIGAISIIDTDIGETLAYIEIPMNTFSEEEDEGTITCGALPAFSTVGLFGALAVALLAFFLRP